MVVFLSFQVKEAPCACHVFRLQREGIENMLTAHWRVSPRSRLVPATCLIALVVGGYIRSCHHSASRSATERAFTIPKELRSMVSPIIEPSESKMQTTMSICGRSPPPACPFQSPVSMPCDTHGQGTSIAGRSVTFRHQRSSLSRGTHRGALGDLSPPGLLTVTDRWILSRQRPARCRGDDPGLRR